MSLFRAVIVAGAALLLAACQVPANQATIKTLEHAGEHPRIVLMPLNVELSELSAAGIPEPKADWTEAGIKNLSAGLHAENTAQNLALVDYDDKSASPELKDQLNQISKLHDVVGQAIFLHQYTPVLQLPTKQGRFDWTLGPSVQKLRDVSNADYALFVFVRDSYSGAGRVALQIVAALAGISVPGGAQIGFISLVDLKTGNVVWYNRLIRGTGDLRTPDPARETAKVLLTGFPK